MLEPSTRSRVVVDHPSDTKRVYVPETPGFFIVGEVLLFVIGPRDVVPEAVIGHRNTVVVVELRVVPVAQIVTVTSISLAAVVDGVRRTVLEVEGVGVLAVVFVLRVAGVPRAHAEGSGGRWRWDDGTALRVQGHCKRRTN